MSLILDQQRKNSNQPTPSIGPLPAVKPQPIEQQLEQQMAEAAPTTTEATNNKEEEKPLIQFPDASVVEEEQVAEPEAEPSSSASLDAALEEALDFTPVSPALPDERATEQTVVGAAQQMPQILQDIGLFSNDSRIYAPEIIQTRKPQLFNTIDTKSTADLIRQGVLALNSTAARRYQAQQQAIEQAERNLSDRNRLVNVPRSDKQWHAIPAENNSNLWLDILFGNEKQRKETNFNPLRGEFGQAGAGLLGGLNYLIGLPLNFFAGLGAEIEELKRRWDEKSLLKLAESNPRAAMATAAFIRGKSKTPFGNINLVPQTPNKEAVEYAQRYIRELFKPTKRTNAIIGYDETKASQRNLLIEALRGAQLGDTNDPKETNKGVFFSPRRPRNVKGKPSDNPIGQFVNDILAVAKSDPLGTAIEIGTQLFNPFDNLVGDVFRAGMRKLSRRGAPKATNLPVPSSSPPPPPSSPPPQGIAGIPNRPGPVPTPPVGSAQWTPTPRVSPSGAAGQAPTGPAAAGKAGSALSSPPSAPSASSAGRAASSLSPPPSAPSSASAGRAASSLSSPTASSSSSGRAFSSLSEGADEPLTMEAWLESEAASRVGAASKAEPAALPEPKTEVEVEFVNPALKKADSLGKTQTEALVRAEEQTLEQTLPPLQEEAWLDKGQPLPPAQIETKALAGETIPSTNVVAVPLDDVEVIKREVPPIAPSTEGIPPTSPGGMALRIGLGRAEELPIKTSSSLFLKGIDDVPGGLKAAPTERLLEAAEQIAAHKAIVRKQLMQLDELFETTYDFGRRYEPLALPYSRLDAPTILRAINNEARLNLPKQALAALTKELREAISEANYDQLSSLLQKERKTLTEFAEAVAKANNEVVESVAKASSQLAEGAEEFVVRAPAKLYHGTAIANWSPSYNLRLYGTRGELGTGLYLIEKPRTVKMYAEALITENAAPFIEGKQLKPAIYEISASFSKSLNARGKLQTSSPIVERILDNIPEPLRTNTLKEIKKNKTTNYNKILDKLEANIVKSGFEPNESFLRDIYATVSENLRQLGFDSVYDKQSGFVLALDETKLKTTNIFEVKKQPTALDAVIARYNADAYSAKYYKDRLSVDANLRDSAAKILNQTEASLDDRLRQILDEIAERKLFDDATSEILPPKKKKQETKKTKPSVSEAPDPSSSMDEQLSSLQNRSTNPCEP
jgi:hypothetical protein